MCFFLRSIFSTNSDVPRTVKLPKSSVINFYLSCRIDFRSVIIVFYWYLKTHLVSTNVQKNQDARILLVRTLLFFPFKLSTNFRWKGVYLVEVHYGFVYKNDIYGNWYNTDTYKVNYTFGTNEDVVIPIPSERARDHHLAYILYFSPRTNRGESFQTETHFVDVDGHNPLAEQTPRFVRLPILNYAPHPWTASQ